MKFPFDEYTPATTLPQARERVRKRVAHRRMTHTVVVTLLFCVAGVGSWLIWLQLGSGITSNRSGSSHPTPAIQLKQREVPSTPARTAGVMDKTPSAPKTAPVTPSRLTRPGMLQSVPADHQLVTLSDEAGRTSNFPIVAGTWRNARPIPCTVFKLRSGHTVILINRT